MPLFVPCALPDRHGTPLFSGQNRPPGSRPERPITKPVGRTTRRINGADRTSAAGTVSLEAPIVALRTAVSAPAAEPFHRLLSEDLQPLLVDVGDAHASHLARHGCHLWPSRQGYFGRERPPQGVLRRCELRNAPVPAPGGKKGGSLPSTSDFPVRHRGPDNMDVTD